jgi:hypothetical protein
MNVYLVRVLKTMQWYPHPFAERELAHLWAQARGHAEDEYEVEGFRVRD